MGKHGNEFEHWLDKNDKDVTTVDEKRNSVSDTNNNNLTSDFNMEHFPEIFGKQDLRGSVRIKCGDHYIQNNTSAIGEDTALSTTTDIESTQWIIGADDKSNQTFILSAPNESQQWFCWTIDASIGINDKTDPHTVIVNYELVCDGSSDVTSLSNIYKWQFRSVMGVEEPGEFTRHFKIKNTGLGRFLTCEDDGTLGSTTGVGNGSGQLYCFYIFFLFCFC